VTNRRTTNIAASVRQRLSNQAKTGGRPFGELLQYFAMERFLYRLSQSPHADKFVLKGALMFTAWRASATRPTRDIDLLGRTQNTVENLVSIVRDVCRQGVADDGMAFDADSVEGKRIKEDAEYEGVRVTFRGHLQNARIYMQIDVAFGDVVTPSDVTTEFPTILDFAAPKLRGYTRESVVAEKFEAMVKLGLLNSRMKDYFDLWLLSRQFDFDGPVLVDAIRRTFARRGTEISAQPVALTERFASDASKIAQWRAFLRKSRIEDAPDDLAPVIDALGTFLLPIAVSIRKLEGFEFKWKTPGPWVSIV
jgi:hypothetical protein